jgi:hypothetical protein
MRLQDFAQVVRSKNAGPRRLTLDVIFRNDTDYQRAVQSEALSRDRIAGLYGVASDGVVIIAYPLGRAIKIVVPRKIMAGDPGDRDAYGAQQHTPLLELDI